MSGAAGADVALARSAVLAMHAGGFVASAGGSLGPRCVQRFQRFLRLRALEPSADELQLALTRAADEFRKRSFALYICDDAPCRRRSVPTGCAVAQLQAGLAGSPVVVQRTGCQGYCKSGPLLSLRIGDDAQTFAWVHGTAERESVAELARCALRADSLLLPPNPADALRFDPTHPVVPLAGAAQLRFLLGHFRGRGRFQQDGLSFTKEVWGGYEAGGRFIALRMSSSYDLSEGGTDTHHAFVLAGAGGPAGELRGYAYTDGGVVREHSILVRGGGALEIDEDLPDHGQRLARARKTITPTAEGYAERVEVDAGAGFFEYSVLMMSRVIGPKQ